MSREQLRRTRYADAPRYSDSHNGMSGSLHENYPALPRGQPAPAIPLRSRASYQYSPSIGAEYRPHSGIRLEGGGRDSSSISSHHPQVMTSGYRETSSIAQQLDLDDDWQAQQVMSTPMLVGAGAVTAHGSSSQSHMLAEFRDSFLPAQQQQQQVPMEERAVIIEPGEERDLNRYLRQGWRVKSTQTGTENAWLVIVEREAVG